MASFADFSSWQQESPLYGDGCKDMGISQPNWKWRTRAFERGRVSPNFFHLVGVGPALGRGFLAPESRAGNDREVILSFALWQHHFAANPNIVGQQIILNQQAYTVAGVMPNGFHFPQAVDFGSRWR